MPKKDNDQVISITNQKIINFFSKHSNLEIEDTIISFIDIMEKLSDTLNNSINSTLVNNLLENIKDVHQKVTAIDSNMNKFHGDIINNFSLKMSEYKKEYINDLKLILVSNVSDKIEPLVREQSTLLYEKTSNMINSIIPKNNDNLEKSITDSIKTFNQSVIVATQKLLENSIDAASLTKFVSTIENKFSNALSSTQLLLSNSISATEQRIDSKIGNVHSSTEKELSSIKEISSSNQSHLNTSLTSTEQRLDSRISEIRSTTERELSSIKEISTQNQLTSSSLNTSLTELLKKMENSSSKGNISENILNDILHNLYPSAQIDDVGQQKETGDIILTRKNKPKILIENKDWNKNVVQEEIKKFLRDVELQNCSGLFLSQNFGIAGKENYEININNGNVLIYVHEVNNDPEKIKIAIDIIDQLKYKLGELEDDSENDTISKEKLESINIEFQAFVQSKLALVKLAKEFNQKFLKQIEDIKIPTLEEYLSTRYATSSSKYVCEYCNFVAKNQSAKSAHLRGCSVKKAAQEKNSPTLSINTA